MSNNVASTIKSIFGSLNSAEKIEVLTFIGQSVVGEKRGGGLASDILDNWEGRILLVSGILTGKIKVVRDFKVSESGRLAAEFRWDGKPSGLLDDNIEWWVFELSGPEYNDEVAIWMRADRLRRLASVSIAARGGDLNASEMLLVELDWLIAANSRLNKYERQTGRRRLTDEQIKAEISRIKV